MAAGPDSRGNIAVVSKARGLNPALSVGQLLVNAGLQDGETVVHIFNSEDREHAEAVAALARRGGGRRVRDGDGGRRHDGVPPPALEKR